MNPIQLPIPALRQGVPSDARKVVTQSISQKPYSHPDALSPAVMSTNAQLALDQIEAYPNGHHQLFALLARNGIADNTLHIQSNQGADAHFGQHVTVPEGGVANLTIRTRLNYLAQYDIVAIDLHISASGKTESIYLSGPPTSVTQDHAPSSMPPRQVSAPTHLAVQYSRNPLTEAKMCKNNPQNYSAVSLPASTPSSTRSMAFSHTVSAAEDSAASRHRADRNARTEPYPASNRSRASTASGSTQPRTRRPGATDGQIRNLLRNPDGTLRTQEGVVNVLRSIGLGSSNSRIISALQEVAGVRLRPSATDEQIKEQARNWDGTLKSQQKVARALRVAGFGADNGRIAALLRAEGGVLHRPSATDDQIRALLRNSDGTLGTIESAAIALRTAGLGAGNERISYLLQEASGIHQRPSTTEGQIKAQIRKPDGTVNPR